MRAFQVTGNDLACEGLTFVKILRQEICSNKKIPSRLQEMPFNLKNIKCFQITSKDHGQQWKCFTSFGHDAYSSTGDVQTFELLKSRAGQQNHPFDTHKDQTSYNIIKCVDCYYPILQKNRTSILITSNMTSTIKLHSFSYQTEKITHTI